MRPLFFAVMIACLVACRVSEGEDPVAPYLEQTPGTMTISPYVSFNLTEGGATGNFNLVLSRPPITSVTISLGDASGQVQFSPSTLSFNAQNWSSQTSVVISAVDDAIVEGIQIANGKIKITKDDPVYLSIPDILVQATVTDNDAPGVSIAATGTSNLVNEDALTDTVMISLSSAPTADVTITFINPAPGRISYSPASMTFTPQNWNTPVSMLLSAYNDAIVQSPGRGIATYDIQAVTASTLVSYNALNVPFTVMVQDND